MKTAYEILGVTPEADDIQIKTAYLTMVKQYPPERCPKEFQNIYRAYELIRSQQDRLQYKFFHATLPDAADIGAAILEGQQGNDALSPGTFRTALHGQLQTYCKKFTLSST